LGILSSSNLHYTTIDINPSTNYTVKNLKIFYINYFFSIFFRIQQTTKIDTGSGNIAYPTGLILNNGEFLAAYRKGNNIFYKKRAFCKSNK
jgi:hypothetical protein